MQITTYTDAAGFDELDREWTGLLTRAVTAPIFSTPQYLRTWWHHLGNGDLRLIAVRNDDGTLVGLAPLYLKRDEGGRPQLVFVGCVDVSDYLDFIVDREHVAEVYAALVDYLDGVGGLEWEHGYFCSLSLHSPTRQQLTALGRAKGWLVREEEEDICPVITLADSWDDYLSGLNKKQRHEIRRKLRKASNEAEVRWYVLEQDDSRLGEAIEVFIDLHQKSSTDKEEFWDETMKAFFRDVARCMAEAGWLRLFFVDIDGAPAASLLCFDYQNELLVYNSGYDAEQFGALSPGNLVIAYSIQHAIEQGRSRYDFLRGDEVYKFRFGGQPEPVHGLHIDRNHHE